jgi:16S rRNA processing protein RimM
VAGFRGPAGELPVRVASGRASRWTGVARFLLEREAGSAAYAVEAARAYGGNLVLKLAGVDDASAAAALRGARVRVPAEDVPPLPSGEYWVARLCGMTVVDEAAGPIGRVEDVEETGGVDLLRVVGPGREVRVPLARTIVTSIDEREIRVRLPEGLLDLDEGAGEEPG